MPEIPRDSLFWKDGVDVRYWPQVISPEEGFAASEAMTHAGVQTRKFGSRTLARQTVSFTSDPRLVGKRAPAIWGDGLVFQEMPPAILVAKRRVENKVFGGKSVFNVCLGNRYVGPKSSIAWHSDREQYGDSEKIGSISIGTQRTIEYAKIREDGKREKLESIEMESGSLVYMGVGSQSTMQHRVPEAPGLPKDAVRDNLTFRIFSGS